MEVSLKYSEPLESHDKGGGCKLQLKYYKDHMFSQPLGSVSLHAQTCPFLWSVRKKTIYLFIIILFVFFSLIYL